MIGLLMTSQQRIPRPKMSNDSSSKPWKLILLGLVITGGIAAVVLFDVQAVFKQALEWIDSLGVWGPVIYIGLYIAATVAFLPGSVLTIGAGVIFGFLGILWVAIGATLGAAGAFLVGRYLARDAIESKVGHSPRFKAIDAAVGENGWKIIGLLRLSPVLPFNLLNYACGLTRVKFWHYFFASAIGMLPGVSLYVYIGTLVGNLAAVGTEQRDTTAGEWIFLGVGFAVSIAVVVYVTRIAQQALQARTDADLSATE